MRRILAPLAFLLFAGAASAERIAPPPASPPPGVVRIWGNPQMEPLVRRWAEAFRKIRPAIRIETNMTGSDVSMAGLYTGKADIALMGREALEMESKAFEWINLYPPTQVEIMTGSAQEAGKSPALAILVHSSNPLAKISLDHLKAVFGAEPPLIRTWGQLGLGGAWGGRKINLYAPESESGTGKFFRQKVLADSNKMNWDQLTEFPEAMPQRPHVDTAGRAIVAALSRDKWGMAIGNLHFRSPNVKAVALLGPDGAAYLPTRTDVGSRAYPLSRSAYAYVNRPVGKPLDSEVASFLRFILSAEGQGIIGNGSGYLPLPRPTADKQLRNLDDRDPSQNGL